jgi:N-succinyldiaminopimelate aminotransferase
MYRMTPESGPSPARATTAGAATARSPFVRLRELLGETPPGQSPISLAVGEPQHPIPSFVGAVIAAHVAEFGRYPMNRGLEEFTAAVGQWLDRRYKLPRRVDPASEVLVLNGTREGLFLAGIAARNYAASRAGKHGKPAVLIPNPF